MLNKLFSSKARVKILTIFLTHPDREFFVRELTRILDEQINSIRRELDNLKTIGLLRSRSKNRKKYFMVNKDFILFPELQGMIMKTRDTHRDLVREIESLGEAELILLSGVFVNHPMASVDAMLVGNFDKQKAADLFKRLGDEKYQKDLRYTIFEPEDFRYRRSLGDNFVENLMADPRNIIPLDEVSVPAKKSAE